MSESEIKHAPLPWTQYAGGTQVYGGDRYFVGITQSKNAEADAAFIVLACNSYYETQAALSAKDAELSILKAGIKRLSDEEELCAETTGDDPFSMVYLAAKISDRESDIERLESALDNKREYASELSRSLQGLLDALVGDEFADDVPAVIAAREALRETSL